MKKIFLFFALCCQAFAQQSYHIIKVIPSGATVGEIDFQGDSTHASHIVQVKSDETTASLKIIGDATLTGVGPLNVISNGFAFSCVNLYNTQSSVETLLNKLCATDVIALLVGDGAGHIVGQFDDTGDVSFGQRDDTSLSVDAGGNRRLGMTKKIGAIPRLTYGSGINFEIGQSDATDIGAVNTFTVHFAINASTGLQEMTANNSTEVLSLVQNGSGSSLISSISNASPVVSLTNAGSGPGLQAVATSNIGISGSSTSSSGVHGISGSGSGVDGTATGGGGVGGSFVAVGLLGVGLTAGGPLYAAHFGTGNVLIDNSLTVTGAITVASCSGCGSGTGTVTSIGTNSPITGGTITTSGTIDCPTCLTTAGTGVSISGGGHTVNIGQPIGTGNSPTFAGGTFNGVTSIVASTAGCGLCVTNSGAGYSLQTNPGSPVFLDGSTTISGFISGLGAAAISGSFSAGALGVATTFNVYGTGLSTITNDLAVGGRTTTTDFTFNGHVCSLVSTVLTCP